ncbi:MAG: VOC family protein [Rhizobiaceae bacterium]|nr:VOC family protein [Rhizobiaceae bacterium]
MADKPQSFFWYELMTTDVAAAASFYGDVVGWTGEAFGGDMAYTVLSASGHGVAGAMRLPPELAGAGVPPCWTGYVYAPDTDLAVASLEQAGGSVRRPPWDIPGVGRLAVVADPQGAVFMLMTPLGEDRPPMPMTTPGHAGWHELYANDWKGAFDFYSGQFGWRKADSFDMGEMGTYQLFSVTGEPGAGEPVAGQPVGGMMDRPPGVPVPCWLFYFNVEAIDAAAQRVTAGGGKILMGPMEVPGGSWVLQAVDPQGAVFALVSVLR